MNIKAYIFSVSCVFSAFTFAAEPSKETTADDKTVLEQEIQAQNRAEKYPNLINLYRPTYILPFYQTNHPYQDIYLNETPDSQRVKNEELKAYFSVLIPVVRHLYRDKPVALNFAYSQLMYWQVYAKSPYFRETNYEPELFIENYFSRYMSGQIGVNHQSNGRGGYLERSWNRAYAQVKFSGQNWLVQLRGWSLLAESESSDLHNPDIAHYLGYENILFSYSWNNLKASIEAQNIESGFKRGYVLASLSYPILKSISLYGQFFNGYGQSLIEYNHKNTGFGIGIAVNDWIN
ncbi:phospholipase A [Legionella gresilensis]|uniref:phospholipase A n=1 Tax=Legionella gresilensis TaxID=91823 RepID=UPI0010417898|nr:phospholipase A [Legionella gresilensis]